MMMIPTVNVGLAIIMLGYFACSRPVICMNMMEGTELAANPYSEAVYIQKKPATTICMGIISDEKTVFTSALCEVGLEPVDSYHIAEIPKYKRPPSTLVHNIKTVRRGKGTPFDLKVITLEEPFEFCGNCSASKVLWVETYDDYTERFQLKTPAVVLGFGAPFKGGIVTYKIKGDRDCKQDYGKVRDAYWPENMPFGGFCIYEGPASIEISIPNKRKPITINPGVPCDDSIGSLVKINDYGRTIGIVLKAFYGTKNVTLGWGSYYLLSLPFEPDGWTPLPPTTTTSATSPISSTTTATTTTFTTSATTTATTSTKFSTKQPRTPTTSDDSKAIRTSISLATRIIMVISKSRGLLRSYGDFTG